MIESSSDYEIMHGEAVAIDVLFSCYLSRQRGYLSSSELERVVALYRTLHLPMWNDVISAELLWSSVQERILHRDGQQLIPMPSTLGSCRFINDVTLEELRSAAAVMNVGVRALTAA